MEKFFQPDSFVSKDDDAMCASEAFCGFPSYNSTAGFWMNATESPTISPSTLNLTSRVDNGNSVQMSFDLIGTFLNLMFIAPAAGVNLVESSVGLTQTKWRTMDVHYLKLTQGKASSDPFTFSLKLEKNQESSAAVTITVVTIDSHFEGNVMAQEYKNLVGSFPDYTFVQTHQADVTSRVFS